MTMRAEYTIDQSTLAYLLGDGAMLQLLPPLSSLKDKQTKKSDKSCRSCGGGVRTTGLSYEDKNKTLRELGNLLDASRETREELKRRLNTKALRVKWRKADSNVFAVKKY
jgi:hypothetical protein